MANLYSKIAKISGSGKNVILVPVLSPTSFPLTKEEILLKLAANNETVQDLVNRIVLAEAAIRNLKTATANNTTAIQGNTQSISNLSLAVEQVKNDYLTKDGAFAIFADTVSVVEGVFYPSSDDSSDDNAL